MPLVPAKWEEDEFLSRTGSIPYKKKTTTTTPSLPIPKPKCHNRGHYCLSNGSPRHAGMKVLSNHPYVSVKETAKSIAEAIRVQHGFYTDDEEEEKAPKSSNRKRTFPCVRVCLWFHVHIHKDCFALSLDWWITLMGFFFFLSINIRHGIFCRR